MNLNVNRPYTVIHIDNKNVILRTIGEKEFVVLYRATISVYNNNVVILSENDKSCFTYLMDKYQQYDRKYGLVQSRESNTIHLLTDEFIIVLYSPIIESLELEDNKLKINIIAHHIEPFLEPNTYIRRTKLEKIMEKLNARKKSRSSSNQGG